MVRLRKVHIIYLLFLISLISILSVNYFGVRLYRIKNNDPTSMYPTFHQGDVVITFLPNIDQIEVGDIIVFEINRVTIIHRVQDIISSGDSVLLRTKGDSPQNDRLDTNENFSYVISFDEVLGKTMFTLPYHSGKLLNALGNVISIILASIIGVVLYQYLNYFKIRQKRRGRLIPIFILILISSNFIHLGNPSNNISNVHIKDQVWVGTGFNDEIQPYIIIEIDLQISHSMPIRVYSKIFNMDKIIGSSVIPIREDTIGNFTISIAILLHYGDIPNEDTDLLLVSSLVSLGSFVQFNYTRSDFLPFYQYGDT